MPTLSNVQWRTVFGAAAAIVAYLLIQTDVPLDPVVKVVLGALSVALAFIKAPADAPAPSGGGG
jgi:hypothetical protein